MCVEWINVFESVEWPKKIKESETSITKLGTNKCISDMF